MSDNKTEVRILIIDRNVEFSALLNLGLQGLGYRVLYATEQETGIALARQFKPHVVIVEFGAANVAKNLRNDTGLAEMRTIAAINGRALENESRSREAGFDLYLEKPFTHQDVHQILSAGPKAS